VKWEVVANELDESTAVHFHGLDLPIDWGRSSLHRQPPIKPAQSYTCESTVPNAGYTMILNDGYTDTPQR
jgi:FtsP/CotA-like multicopper oxidase with cupredoxin domain